MSVQRHASAVLGGRAAFLLLLASPALGQIPIPQPSYQVGQTFYETNYSATNPAAYPVQQDADRALVQHAFSFVVVNTATGQHRVLGFSTPEVPNRPGDACPFPQVIDRHQGIRGYRAANGWLIVGNYAGAPTCKNIVIFRFNGTRYVKTGDVDVPGFFTNALSTAYGIINDTAYAPTGFNSWARIDLINRVVTSTGNVFQDSPRPQDWRVDGNPGAYFLVPSGNPPLPTATPGVQPTWTPTPATTGPPATATPVPSATPCSPGVCRPAPAGPGCWNGCDLCQCPTLTPTQRPPATLTPTTAPTQPPSSTPVSTATPSVTPSAVPAPGLTTTPPRMTPVIPTPRPTRPTVDTLTVTPGVTSTPIAEPGPSSGRSGSKGLIAGIVAAVLLVIGLLTRKKKGND